MNEVNPYEPPKTDLKVRARRISYAIVVLLALVVAICAGGTEASAKENGHVGRS
jgi:hypothetical protein